MTDRGRLDGEGDVHEAGAYEPLGRSVRAHDARHSLVQLGCIEDLHHGRRRGEGSNGADELARVGHREVGSE